MAARSGHRLKLGTKHLGLGAIKFLSQKANKVFSLQILQKRKKCVHGFKILRSSGRSYNLFCAEIKAKECPARDESAGELETVETNYLSF